ncbi:helix-turn-helix domain-containing protein [Streptomyces shenzhenensis]|uniref:helix-turn-helix domain-containing protein n=1 Tax=Streptomyces shenzhenensis TaxID=943815 RepID=UPI00286802A6|nr:helix-turn-helix transcriptional regulator [Streptomyces shenzhenensis]
MIATQDSPGVSEYSLCAYQRLGARVILPTVGTQDIDWATFGDLKDAARAGDFGSVIRRARQIAGGMTQGQLGEALGLSQAAVSRLENYRAGTYNMDTLAKAATALGLPFELVGLANQQANRTPPVERREFLTTALVAAAQPIGTAITATSEWDNSQAAALRIATSSFRRLDATVASRDLSEAVKSHLRLVQVIAGEAPDETHRSRMASVGSEAASFAAWLAWDMADHGSARRLYGASIKAARSSNNSLLTAYQTGSLASFEAETGNPHEALRLVTHARQQLGVDLPPLAAAWMSAIEAVAHATSGQHRACDRALKACEQHAARIPDADPVAWPWIFAFDDRKIAACRITCTARLGQPLHSRIGELDIASALGSGHDKQRALLTLDVAAGYLATKEIDTAFRLAERALQEGVRLRSGKIAERARALRRAYLSPRPPSIVRAFDDQLHATHL